MQLAIPMPVAPRPAHLFVHGQPVRHTTTGELATVWDMKTGRPHDGAPGWRFVVVDVHGAAARRTCWIENMVEAT